MKVIINNFYVNKIPILEISPKKSIDKKALIIIIHGFTGKKENNLYLAYRFARIGYIVVVFDAYLHGELKNSQFESYTRIERISKIPIIITESCLMLSEIIKNYTESMKTIMIGLVGISMGGFIAFQYLSRKNRYNISMVVSLISTPHWLTPFEKTLETDLTSKRYLTQELLDEIDSIQASNFYDNFHNTPILMLNGEDDEKYFLDDVKSTIEDLRTNYDDSNFKSIIYSGDGHQVTDKMIDETEKWINAFIGIST